MQFIWKTKIEQKRSKPTITYPLIRLPREFAEIIGTPATVYQTQHKDNIAFFVILGDNNDSLLKGEVGQLCAKVVQPNSKNRLEARVADLEKEISELRELIFLNEGDGLHKNLKK
ncbi:MAG: hypothetical protein ACXV5F_06885 [Halobacteriota archaeon]